MAKSFVVIEKARELDYLTDFVVLPDSFGTEAYDKREDVIAIRACVDSALDKLDEKVHFSRQLAYNRPVVIKPNLV